MPIEKQYRYQAEIERYSREKAVIQKDAEKFEAESREWDERSAQAMHVHHRWAQATTFLQIAIAFGYSAEREHRFCSNVNI